jgi:hypothetical protein
MDYPVTVLVPVKENRRAFFEAAARPAYEAAGAEVLTHEATPNGPALAWNTMAKEATSEWIFFGGDDVIVSRTIFKVLMAISQEADLVAAAFGWFDPPSRPTAYLDMRAPADCKWTVEYLLEYNFVGMYMVRREKFLGFNEEFHRFCDWDYLIRACKAGHGLTMQNDILAIAHQVGDETISDPKTEAEWSDKVRAQHKVPKPDWELYRAGN